MLHEEPTIHCQDTCNFTLPISSSNCIVPFFTCPLPKKLAMRQGAYLRVIPGNSNQEVRGKVGREDSHTGHACELYFTLQLGLSLTEVL